MDNIGSYQKIEIIEQKNVSSMGIFTNTFFVTVQLKPGAEWLDIPFQLGSKNSIISIPSITDAGTVYFNEVTIYIPNQLMSDELLKKIESFRFFRSIIRYTTNNGDIFIIGSNKYPLSADLTTIHPGEASGFCGWKLHLTGKSTYHPIKTNI